jgi:hypothetical protein
MVMDAIPEPDAEFVFRTQKPVNLPGVQISLPGTGGVGPQVPERFTGQEGTGRDEGLEKMLVKGQVAIAPDERFQTGAEPRHRIMTGTSLISGNPVHPFGPSWTANTAH